MHRTAKLNRQAVVGVRVQVRPQRVRRVTPSGRASHFEHAISRDALPFGYRLVAHAQRGAQFGYGQGEFHAAY